MGSGIEPALLRPALVKWMDANFSGGWRTVEDANMDPSICYSLGWTQRNPAGDLTIVETVGFCPVTEGVELMNLVTIPAGMVEEVHFLDEVLEDLYPPLSSEE